MDITLISRIPPNTIPPHMIGADYSDYIRDLGDRIAALSLEEAKELEEYVADQIS